MSLLRSLSTAGVLVALGGMPRPPAGPDSAQFEPIQAKPMEITSDTPEYCLHLRDRVSDMMRMATAPVPHEVVDLSAEGQRMCANGQTRGGIMRLRNALVIMEKRPSGYR